MNKNLESIKLIAETEFASIVEYSFILDYKLRIILIDKSFVDINVSTKLKNKFGFHLPFHFHYKIQDNVIAPPFPKELLPGFRGFMDFVKNQILSETK